MPFPAVALMPLLIGLPIGLLWFREPRADERPEGISDASGAVVGITLREAAKGYRFWLLVVSILIIALAYGGAHIHIAQIVGLHGYSPQVAANVLGVVALGSLADGFSSGFSSTASGRPELPSRRCSFPRLPAGS
jgi:hypothetical protein